MMDASSQIPSKAKVDTSRYSGKISGGKGIVIAVICFSGGSRGIYAPEESAGRIGLQARAFL
jgi:hypothetical protein